MDETLPEPVPVFRGKPRVCIDFDGVLHSYVSGWQGVDVIPDPPVPGAMEWLAAAVREDTAVIAVHSSRSNDPKGISAMKQWFWRYFDRYLIDKIEFPGLKPPAVAYIDDRGWRFAGQFESLNTYLNTPPWHLNG